MSPSSDEDDKAVALLDKATLELLSLFSDSSMLCCPQPVKVNIVAMSAVAMMFGFMGFFLWFYLKILYIIQILVLMRGIDVSSSVK
jgi:hypothetical protein